MQPLAEPIRAMTRRIGQTVACDGPGAKEAWITELRETAVKQASDDERAMALILLKRWVEGRRE